MSTVLASTLSSKPVMGSDGTELGTVHNITMNVETGELEYALVDPVRDNIGRFDRDENGLLVVPAGRLRSVGDYLVVD